MIRKSKIQRPTSTLGWLPVVTLLGLIPPLASQGALFMDVGTVELQPNQPGQQVTFSIENTGSAQSVTGLELWVQIGDGFSEVPGSSHDGPNLTALDLITGTAFSDNNSGQTDFLFSQLAGSMIATTSGTVTLQPGLNPIGTLTLDTTGFSGGTWDLKFQDVFSISGPRASRYAVLDGGTPVALDIEIQNGQLAVVPEPSTIISAVLLGLFALGHVASDWYRRRTPRHPPGATFL